MSEWMVQLIVSLGPAFFTAVTAIALGWLNLKVQIGPVKKEVEQLKMAVIAMNEEKMLIQHAFDQLQSEPLRAALNLRSGLEALRAQLEEFQRRNYKTEEDGNSHTHRLRSDASLLFQKYVGSARADGELLKLIEALVSEVSCSISVVRQGAVFKLAEERGQVQAAIELAQTQAREVIRTLEAE